MQGAPTFCLQVALLLLQAAACLLLMDDLLVWRFQFVSIVLLVTIAFFIVVMGQIRFSVACFIISHHILETCCKFCDCFEKMNPPSSISLLCAITLGYLAQKRWWNWLQQKYYMKLRQLKTWFGNSFLLYQSTTNFDVFCISLNNVQGH